MQKQNFNKQEQPAQNLYDVVFLYENNDLQKDGLYKFYLSKRNIQKLVAAKILCNVLVVLLTNQTLYSIGELKVEYKNKVRFVNGVIYNFTLTKLIERCQNKKILKYLKRISQKDYKFTMNEKIQFVENAISIKSFPKLYLRSFPIPFIYKNDKSSIIKIDSPIIEMIPQLINLQEAHPIKEQDANISKNPNIYKRVLRQIIEVNQDFHSLRTVITPDLQGRMNIFNFVMYPNDGAFCSLPLIGRLIINQNYPVNPPVFHLFTRTNRFNLDVYNSMARNNSMDGSSICFDLVKPITNPQSAWKPQFTISTVFASIMSAIVSYKVLQMGGGNYQAQQFVTMQKLQSSFKNVKEQIITRWKQLTRLPTIPTIKSARMMCKQIKYSILSQWQTYYFNRFQQKIISYPINLQQDCWTAEFILNKLSPQYVLSFILTNDVNDIHGYKSQTVLFRNGVTATAAKKLIQNKIAWFYHGRPLNNGQMKLNITITPNQFVFSYKNSSTDGDWIVHGDTPITSLQKKIVGDLKYQKFYLVIYVKNKNMYANGQFNITQVFTNIGYIHKNSQQKNQ